MAIGLASTALTIQEFSIRLKELWENLERCGEPTAEPYRVEQLMAKLEFVFPIETRRPRDLRHLYIIKDCPGLRFLQDLSAC